MKTVSKNFNNLDNNIFLLIHEGAQYMSLNDVLRILKRMDSNKIDTKSAIKDIEGLMIEYIYHDNTI